MARFSGKQTHHDKGYPWSRFWNPEAANAGIYRFPPQTHLDKGMPRVSPLRPGEHACLRFRNLLLPNRPVPVLPFTLKETVMHHAYSEEQNKEEENNHE